MCIQYTRIKYRVRENATNNDYRVYFGYIYPHINFQLTRSGEEESYLTQGINNSTYLTFIAIWFA
jgi:hypothetical protein